jgi:hypothetical protein
MTAAGDQRATQMSYTDPLVKSKTQDEESRTNKATQYRELHR